MAQTIETKQQDFERENKSSWKFRDTYPIEFSGRLSRARTGVRLGTAL